MVAAAIVAAVLICQGGGSDGGSSSSTTASGADGCKEVEAPQPKTVSFKAPKQVLKPGEKATAVVKTSCGTFEIALDTTRAPKTANSFAFLAEEGFYDDLTFHRIVPGFVIQGGDPEGTGTGGPGYSVDEKPPRQPRLHQRHRGDGEELGRAARALRQPVLRRHRARRRACRPNTRWSARSARATRRWRGSKRCRRRTKNRNSRSLIEEITIERP